MADVPEPDYAWFLRFLSFRQNSASRRARAVSTLEELRHEANVFCNLLVINALHQVRDDKTDNRKVSQRSRIHGA